MGCWKTFVDHTVGFPNFGSADDLVRSNFVSWKTLFGYRIFALVYVGFWNVANQVTSEGQGNYFFTYMSYEVLWLHFLFVFVLTLVLKPWKECPEKPNNSTLRFSKLALVLCETISTNAPVVVIMYWAFLATPKPPFKTAITINMHGINLPLIWIDTFLHRKKFYPSHVIYDLAGVIGYMIFSWVYYFVSGVWIYYFLNIYNSRTAIEYYGLLLVLFIVMYFVVYGLVALRNYLGSKSRNSSVETPTP